MVLYARDCSCTDTVSCLQVLTRKVALSKRRTSSASRMVAKLLRLDSSWWTFGISRCTMLDHACGRRERGGEEGGGEEGGGEEGGREGEVC